MTFDINQFRSEIQSNGYLRPWEYNVLITPPSGLQNSQYVQQNQSTNGGNLSNMISLRATQARTPSAQLEWLDIPRYSIGLKQSAPYNARIKNIHFAIMCDKHGNLYNFFYTWMNYVFAHNPLADSQGGGVSNMNRATYILNYKDSYSTDVTINMYDLMGDLAMKFSMRQAFPVTISEILLDWDQTKALVELSIVMNFFEYSLVTSNLGQGTLDNSIVSPSPVSNPTLSPILNS